jgi:hypothetical protein
MNAQKVAYRTQSIVTTRKLSIGMLATLFVIGGDSARASVIIADGLQILASSSQTQTQTELDLYACATWATDQTGFDPITRAGGIPPTESTARHSEYRRAMAACLQGRGYTVSMATPPAPSAASPAPPPVATVSPADASAPPGKWNFLGSYPSPIGDQRDSSAVIDLTSSYNYDYVVYYVWVGGGFVQQGGNWTPGSQQWASSNLDIDCKHHTFKEHRFINKAGSIPRSDDRWIAIEDAWQPIQLAERQVCEQFQ